MSKRRVIRTIKIEIYDDDMAKIWIDGISSITTLENVPSIIDDEVTSIILSKHYNIDDIHDYMYFYQFMEDYELREGEEFAIPDDEKEARFMEPEEVSCP